MSDQQTSQTDWESCAAGEVGGLVHRLKGQRRRRLAFRVAGAGCLLLAVTLLGVGIYGSLSDLRTDGYHFGGITCREVRGHLEDYMAGRTPEDLRARIDAHFQECPDCPELMRMMNRDMPARHHRVSTTGRSVTWLRHPASADERAARQLRLASGIGNQQSL